MIAEHYIQIHARTGRRMRDTIFKLMFWELHGGSNSNNNCNCICRHNGTMHMFVVLVKKKVCNRKFWNEIEWITAKNDALGEQRDKNWWTNMYACICPPFGHFLVCISIYSLNWCVHFFDTIYLRLFLSHSNSSSSSACFSIDSYRLMANHKTDKKIASKLQTRYDDDIANALMWQCPFPFDVVLPQFAIASQLQ